MIKLPEVFEGTLKNKLGAEFNSFKESIEQTAPVSIRLNPNKKTKEEDYEILSKVPWSENGRYLKSRPIFTLDPAFHAGAYYVQEASSMFLEYAIKKTVDFEKPLKVLDLCAAPGGKSSLIASLLGEKDFLLVNEVIKSRLAVLKENMLKWGFTNYVVANQDPETFADLEGFFDLVLVDAPCSGEGLFRKDKKAVEEWSQEHVNFCSSRQKRILSAAAMLVAPGGTLIYSTCTYNDIENSENTSWLTRTLDFESVSFEVPEEWRVVKEPNGYQFYPHKLQGEGFYLSVFRQLGSDNRFVSGKIGLNRVSKNQREVISKWLKPDFFENTEFYTKNEGIVTAIPRNLLEIHGSVFKALFKRSSGFEIGVFKGNDFIPSHALALSLVLNAEIQKIELSQESALRYLKKEAFDLTGIDQGWALVCYQNLPLGWIKKIQERMNNYLPTEWRIRMEID
jgi:16S rRNA C967 or C1407 C5-methylase (RsmB/RsmF family)/NOL1/NOP2/fmu family ribosome biogenesis protein